MAHFIELHEGTGGSEPIFINIDAIGYISPDTEGAGCFIYFYCTSLLSNQRSMMEVKHVVESYQRVKNLIDE